MIFITLGSQKFQFNRLLKAVDEIAVDDEIFAQIGYSDYKPQHYEYKEFLDRDEFERMMSKADIVITHGGTGAIIEAVKKGKKVIAVPRLKKYGEHVDNHQTEIVNVFSEEGYILKLDEDVSIDSLIKVSKTFEPKTFVSNAKRFTEKLEKEILPQ